MQPQGANEARWIWHVCDCSDAWKTSRCKNWNKYYRHYKPNSYNHHRKKLRQLGHGYGRRLTILQIEI